MPAPPPQTPLSADAPPESVLPRSRGPLIAATALLVLCGATLLGLALFASNPVVLNADQLARADLIVTGVREGQDFLVDREWLHGEALGRITIVDLPVAAVAPEQRYLIPLTRRGTSYRVTPTRRAAGDLLIYPATPEALDQLARLLPDAPASR